MLKKKTPFLKYELIWVSEGLLSDPRGNVGLG
jgi:hypothetical protein